MNVTAQKFQSQYAPVCKSLAWSNHRTTLPQSRIRSTAPSEREPGGVRTIHRAARKPEGCGRFSSPLRRAGGIQPAARKPQRCGRFSSPLRRAGGIQPAARKLQRWRAIFIAPTEGGWHSTHRPETATLRAIFIAPTKGCAIQPTMFPMAQVRDRRRCWWSR